MRETPATTSRPYLGYGLGLRTEHYDSVLQRRPAVDWFEITSENYMIGGGKALHILERVRADYPMVMHGVSLSIGGTDPLDEDYLGQLKALAARVEPEWISDHLCWTAMEGQHLHDLLPLPYTEEAVRHVAERVCRVQDFLGRQILLENVSSYLTYTCSQMPEWEFLDAVARRADCLILLDINNVHVSSHNHCFDPLDYINALPAERIRQFHLAGHSHNGPIIVDTHDQPVIEPVWQLYAAAVRRFGMVSTMIERDDNIPALTELLDELQRARTIAAPILKSSAA